MTLGQRFARFVTRVVVARPRLWRLLRRPMVHMFDSMAPEWEETRVSPQHRLPLEAALDAVPQVPVRALDVGTGTGVGARVIAARFPTAAVVGVDASEPMILEARARAGSDRERYDVGDATALPYEDAAFDLVTQLNMIPFFDELARVTAPGGHLAVAFSARLEHADLGAARPRAVGARAARLHARSELLGRRRNGAACPA